MYSVPDVGSHHGVEAKPVKTLFWRNLHALRDSFLSIYYLLAASRERPIRSLRFS